MAFISDSFEYFLSTSPWAPFNVLVDWKKKKKKKNYMAQNNSKNVLLMGC